MQRHHREERLAGSGLVPIFPLWNRPTEMLARRMIAGGLTARLTAVDQTTDFASGELKTLVEFVELNEDGEPIDEKRLDSVPWTPYCLKHQSELEQRARIRTPSA